MTYRYCSFCRWWNWGKPVTRQTETHTNTDSSAILILLPLFLLPLRIPLPPPPLPSFSSTPTPTPILCPLYLASVEKYRKIVWVISLARVANSIGRVRIPGQARPAHSLGLLLVVVEGCHCISCCANKGCPSWQFRGWGLLLVVLEASVNYGWFCWQLRYWRLLLCLRLCCKSWPPSKGWGMLVLVMEDCLLCLWWDQ